MVQRVVLGVGAGHCGLGLLATILSVQRRARITLGQPPLLPWDPYPGGPGIAERMARWKGGADVALIGDVAAFYLPYAEVAIAADARIRMICLKRPEAEVVAGFRNHINRTNSLLVNHWARDPAPGWTHHPILTQTYPQYDSQDRDQGLSRYWHEYYERADDLQRRFRQNFLVVDGNSLNDAEGVRVVLDFVGIAREMQNLATGRPAEPAGEAIPVVMPPVRGPLDPKRCVVLVPFTSSIVNECEEALRELERRGYPVRRVGGYAAIDQGRNQMATDALVEGFEETLWIDSDIAFRPDDVEVLRRHAAPDRLWDLSPERTAGPVQSCPCRYTSAGLRRNRWPGRDSLRRCRLSTRASRGVPEDAATSPSADL